jgi:hypothetical protein
MTQCKGYTGFTSELITVQALAMHTSVSNKGKIAKVRLSL